MKFLADFFPILLFFVAYKMYDIYVATAVAIAAAALQTLGFWLRHRRFDGNLCTRFRAPDRDGHRFGQLWLKTNHQPHRFRQARRG